MFEKFGKKGLLMQLSKWAEYYLTEKGFLKANKVPRGRKIVSFKDYKERANEIIKERSLLSNPTLIE